MKTPRWIRNLLDRFSRTYTTPSGKRTKRRGVIDAFGEKSHIIMPLNAQGTVDWTLDEIAAMTIQCAWCGRPIFISDPITLYSPVDPDSPIHPLIPKPQKPFEVPSYAVIYQQNPLQLIGCPRWDCAETSGDFSGQWVPDPKTRKGTVMRQANVSELLMMNPDATAVIGNIELDGSIRTEIIS